MGCKPSKENELKEQKIDVTTKKSDLKKNDDDEEESYFWNLDMSEDEKCYTKSFISQMDKLKLPYLDTHSILLSMKDTKQWSIYFHFSSWKGSINTAVIENLRQHFENAMKLWLSKLKGYNGFPVDRIELKVFGFVFHPEVQIDESFYKSKYASYPRIENWKFDTSTSPWICDPPIKFSNKKQNLTKTKVISCKFFKEVKCFPRTFSNFKHPEDVTYFQTKFWLTTNPSQRSAQRHYLTIGGNEDIFNFANGKLTKEPLGLGNTILIHEMGHVFFLDDLYDKSKYKDVDCGKNVQDPSIMFARKKLDNIDVTMIRHVWDKQVTFDRELNKKKKKKNLKLVKN